MKKSILFLAVVLCLAACNSNVSNESSTDSTVVDSTTLIDSVANDSTLAVPVDSTLKSPVE